VEGPALADFTGSEWAHTEARRLDELRAVAREQLLAARLDSGETAMVAPEAEALLAEEPLREERWRLLALALYRAHRQGDALASLRRARERLAEELGVDPGPALRALEAEILAQSPALDAPLPRARTSAARGQRPADGPVPVPSSAGPPPALGSSTARASSPSCAPAWPTCWPARPAPRSSWDRPASARPVC